jgi:prophage DNA circulation protein
MPTNSIMELASGRAWRARWLPAKFRNARFHVEAGSRESGRRIVSHEFPKRDLPYAEDMGMRAREFTVRGYIVVYPKDAFSTNTQISSELQKKNYIPARDALIKALEEEGPSELQLPLLGAMKVVCTRYRVTEEKRLGGYCVFDMSFTEYGQAPAEGTRESKAGVEYAAAATGDAGNSLVSRGIGKASGVGNVGIGLEP